MAPAPDLTFTDGDECMNFPRYLYSPRYRSAAGVRQALRDLRGYQGRDWRDPAFVVHILRRLYWLKRHGVHL